MTELDINFPLVILLIGAIIIAIHLVKAGIKRIGIPSMVGFMLLGFLIRLSDTQWNFVTPGLEEILLFMAKIGVITLLFRIGLGSNLKGLMRQLKNASFIWMSGVTFSAFLGFVTSFYLLRFELVPSLFIATAFTATSVGVPVSIWQEAKALKTKHGELLVDVAEIDDISGIVFMAVLFSVVPVLGDASSESMTRLLLFSIGGILLKLLIFGAGCTLFSLYVERHVTEFAGKIASTPGSMLMVAGIGFMIAALAGMLGFSIAIGAFLAGLAFSRDPKAVKIDTSYKTLFELFSPFFFIGIGMMMDPGVLTTAVVIGLILSVSAFFGKLVGHGLPSVLTIGGSGALLIGLSMVPRAEITMIIMQRGHAQGSWAVPAEAYAGMVIVSLLTCIISPVIVQKLLRHWRVVGGEVNE
ncbi:MAG: cation:proton antiporter [candidate division Zixibacteria bacterium]|nr:cation:proton antiporter [candidate division Zixibacteria bacterium]